MILKFFNRRKLDIFYLFAFSLFLLAIISKFVLNVFFLQLPCSVNYILSVSFLYRAAILFSLFYILYVASYALRMLLCLKYVTTGFFCFFALTFIGNLILGILGLSSAFNEFILLYVFLFVLIAVYILYQKNLPKKFLAVSFIIVSFLILTLLPPKAFWSNPLFLTDEIALWRPIARNYFHGGLAYSMLHIPSFAQGYGQFIPHIFVTLKRLALFNSGSAPSYGFMPNVLFFVGLFFLLEIKIRRSAKVLLAVFFIFYVFVQRWVAILLCDSLMTDGVSGLMLAIVLREALEKNIVLGGTLINRMRYFVGFWVSAGALGLTKPFVSFICYIMPFSFIKEVRSRINIARVLLKVLLAAVLMAVCFILWVIISRQLNLSRLLAYKPQALSYFHPMVFLDMLRFWIVDKYFIPVFVFLGLGLFLGANRFNRFDILACLFFIATNFLFITSIYIFYGQGWEIESSYRFLVQMFYVSFYALGLSLHAVIFDVFSDRADNFVCNKSI